MVHTNRMRRQSDDPVFAALWERIHPVGSRRMTTTYSTRSFSSGSVYDIPDPPANKIHVEKRFKFGGQPYGPSMNTVTCLGHESASLSSRCVKPVR